MKIDLSHVLHYPPQPTTVAGLVIIGAGLFLAPEVAWPALIAGLLAIIGDDGTRPKEESDNDEPWEPLEGYERCPAHDAFVSEPDGRHCPIRGCDWYVRRSK